MENHLCIYLKNYPKVKVGIHLKLQGKNKIMSIFKGNNQKTPIKSQIIHKARFETRAYDEEGPEIFEFNFIEYQMYGAIDLEGSSIYPNSIQMKNFQTSPNQLSDYRAFDFGTQMYLDAKKYTNCYFIGGAC